MQGKKSLCHVQYLIMIKTQKLGLEWNFFDLIKNIYQKPIEIIFSKEAVKNSPIKSGAKQGYSLAPFL